MAHGSSLVNPENSDLPGLAIGQSAVVPGLFVIEMLAQSN
jgi:hypothetical protein